MMRWGLVWAGGCLLAVAIFAAISIDRTQVENITILDGPNAKQLLSVRTRLGEVDASTRDLAQIKTLLTALDWVHHVNVRKAWPDGISIKIYPEQIIAYWNDDGFINEEGEALVTDLLIGGDLPHLYGPEGEEQEVMVRYQQFNRMLAGYGHTIEALRYSERGAWIIETKDGLQVLLGKEDLKARMQSLLTVSENLRLAGDIGRVERMDARYSNGVAVRFVENDQLQLSGVNNSVKDANL